MASLSFNERSFVDLMKRGEGEERYGFQTLAKRPDAPRFFEPLDRAGLFAVDRVPGARQGEEPGTTRWPYWPALIYLTELAKQAGQTSDNQLATKIMGVVRRITRDGSGTALKNPQVGEAFSEILAELPCDAIDLEDAHLSRQWLDGHWAFGPLSASLGRVVRKLLSCAGRENSLKALYFSRECLRVRWEHGSFRTEDPVLATEPFWTEQIIPEAATELGRRIGIEAAKVFASAVREVYDPEPRLHMSWLFRPAVEDHTQNFQWRVAENLVVVALRNALDGWLASNREVPEAHDFVASILVDDAEVLRRIGIYALDRHWARLGDLYSNAARQLFVSGHRHELYWLLKNHFSEFDPATREKTICTIETLTLEGVDPRVVLYEKRRWIRALDQTDPDVMRLIKALEHDGSGVFDAHPDFNAYMESSVGPGPSPYAAEDLVAFAKNGTLVTKLNDFKPSAEWVRGGPTVSGLTEELRKAVSMAPETFLDDCCRDLHDAGPDCQDAILRTYQALWKANSSNLDWDWAWPRLIGYLEQLAMHTVERGYMLGAAADLLAEGARDDEHAYSPDLLPRARVILKALARKAECTQKPEDSDPMTRAVNSSKGRVIVALITHSLRECRLSDGRTGSHEEVWEELKPLFDAEMEACQDTNYEFYTLAGEHILQLDYMSHEWLAGNLDAIFPVERLDGMECALAGLNYAPNARQLFDLLRDGGIFERGFDAPLRNRKARERLVHELVRAYGAGNAELDKKPVSLLFEENNQDELEAAACFFSTAQHHNPTPAYRDRAVAFWTKCMEMDTRNANATLGLRAALASLAWALPDASGKHKLLLEFALPGVTEEFRYHKFVRELIRLADPSPVEVGEILLSLLVGRTPAYDYDNLLAKLARKLAEKGQREVALQACQSLPSLPGMADLYKSLRHDLG